MANGYLGEEVVADLKDTPYARFTPTEWALDFIFSSGQVDGDHHKQWVLDQVARVLCGTPVTVKKASWDAGANVRHIEWRTETGEPSAKYLAWVEDWKSEKSRALNMNLPTEDIALEIIAIHGCVAPEVTLDTPNTSALCMTLHAFDEHKAWMLDQVARVLHGAPSPSGTTPKYLAWVEEMKGEKDEDGEYTYGYNLGEPLPTSMRGPRSVYDEGIAP